MFNSHAQLTDTDIEREITKHAGIEQKAMKMKSDALKPQYYTKCYMVDLSTHNLKSGKKRNFLN